MSGRMAVRKIASDISDDNSDEPQQMTTLSMPSTNEELLQTPHASRAARDALSSLSPGATIASSGRSRHESATSIGSLSDQQQQCDEEQQQRLQQKLIPTVIGGYNFTSGRPNYDKNSRCLVLSDDQSLIYYDRKSGRKVAEIYPDLSPYLNPFSIKDGIAADSKVDEVHSKKNSKQIKPDAEQLKSCSEENDKIVWSEQFAQTLYVGTLRGRLGHWNLSRREWIYWTNFPMLESENLISFRLLSATKFLFSVVDNSDPEHAILFTTYSQSPLERFQGRVACRQCSIRPNAYDFGFLSHTQEEQQPKPFVSLNQTNKNLEDDYNDRNSRRSCFIVSVAEHKMRISVTYSTGPCKSAGKSNRRVSQHYIPTTKFTCARANPSAQMVAAGDTIGRIFLYFDDIFSPHPTRSLLHWHQLPVNDLCFSQNGNTLFSCGGESGAVVCWEMSRDLIGQKLTITRLGMPIRYLSYNPHDNEVITCHVDNAVQIFQAGIRSPLVGCVRNFTRGQCHDNVKSLKYQFTLRWHSLTDSIVANEAPGVLQFYSPHRQEPVYLLDLLQLNPPSYERYSDIYQSDITQLAISSDGEWIAIIESFCGPSDPEYGPKVLPHSCLKFWRLDENGSWKWIMTEDRPHLGHAVCDLKFSHNSRYLVSVGADQKFRLWYQVSLSSPSVNRLRPKSALENSTLNDTQDVEMLAIEDGKIGDSENSVTSNPGLPSGNPHGSKKECDLSLGTSVCPAGSKKVVYAFARGFVGDLDGQATPLRACFTDDSSLLALAVNNCTIAIWTIVNGSKLRYETQLGMEMPIGGTIFGVHPLIDMSFGYEQCAHLLCDVRKDKVYVWSILDPNFKWEYCLENDEIVTVAFDQFHNSCPSRDQVEENENSDDENDNDEDLIKNNFFVLFTRNNQVLLFNLDNLGQEPLLKLDIKHHSPTLIQTENGQLAQDVVYVKGAIFVESIISPRMRKLVQSSSDLGSSLNVVEPLSRLCMLNNKGELLCFDDRLQLEQYKSQVSFDRLETISLSDLGQFLKISPALHDDEDSGHDVEGVDVDMEQDSDEPRKKIRIVEETKLATERSIKIKQLERMFDSVASHMLPPMDQMASLILETFVRTKDKLD